jgi:hypothetical protein
MTSYTITAANGRVVRTEARAGSRNVVTHIFVDDEWVDCCDAVREACSRELDELVNAVSEADSAALVCPACGKMDRDVSNRFGNFQKGYDCHCVCGEHFTAAPRQDVIEDYQRLVADLRARGLA